MSPSARQARRTKVRGRSTVQFVVRPVWRMLRVLLMVAAAMVPGLPPPPPPPPQATEQHDENDQPRDEL